MVDVLLKMLGWIGIDVWVWVYGCCREESGETWRSRPSDPVSPRRDLQKQVQARARALAQAGSSRFEWGIISLRRERLS